MNCSGEHVYTDGIIQEERGKVHVSWRLRGYDGSDDQSKHEMSAKHARSVGLIAGNFDSAEVLMDVRTRLEALERTPENNAERRAIIIMG